MNVADINIGDEVRSMHLGAWATVKHIEGDLVVVRHSDRTPGAYMAEYVTEVRRPVTALGYEWAQNGSYCYALRHVMDNISNNDATHVVTHWSDGTCTIDTITAFREAHQ